MTGGTWEKIFKKFFTTLARILELAGLRMDIFEIIASGLRMDIFEIIASS